MTRRIALLSDAHGNLPALEAVLSDIAVSGVSEVYCLGDLVGYGPDPNGVVDRIRDAGIPTIQGNYDDGIGHQRGECGCYYSSEQARSDGAASYAFTDQVIGNSQRAWLRDLPSQLRLEENGVRVLLAHGSPRKINEYLLLDRPESQLVRLAEAADADVVCVGHVHIPYHRSLGMTAGGCIHYVSSGSVGKPKDGDVRAAWVELAIGTRTEIGSLVADDPAAGPAGQSDMWIAALVHRVAYDVEGVAEAMRQVGLPHTLVAALRSA